jgi:hypothetical protein
MDFSCKTVFARPKTAKCTGKTINNAAHAFQAFTWSKTTFAANTQTTATLLTLWVTVQFALQDSR